MRNLLAVLTLAALCGLLACRSSRKAPGDVLTAAQLRPLGRTALAGAGLELISSGAHFGFRFKGPACTVYASVPGWLDHNYLQYELDGRYHPVRLRVSKGGANALRIEAPGDGDHTVWLFKATEATTGPVFIQEVRATGVIAVAQSDATPLIEFIGNSITCGAASDTSEVPCGAGFYHDQHNAYLAYGPRVARALGARFILSSVSGIGIYRSWNARGPSMPAVYDRLRLQEQDSVPWDTSRQRPQVISIALGTNDLSDGDGAGPRAPFDSALFTGRYIEFVRRLQLRNPRAQIVLLGSPMTGGAKGQLLERCLSAVKAQVDKGRAARVALYFFRPMTPRGCTWHPDVEDHALLAGELTPFFSNLLQR